MSSNGSARADASDVLTAEIAAEQAKVEFVNAQRMFLAAFAQLATSSGQARLDPHPLTGELVSPPELDAEATVLTDAEQSPTVKQAQANVTVAEARLKSAQREKVPNLNLKAGEWYSGEVLGATNLKAGPGKLRRGQRAASALEPQPGQHRSRPRGA